MAPVKFTPVKVDENKKRPKRQKGNSPEPKLETTLWAAADKLRGHMDAAEYKHVVLGLIFLKYISDAFEEHQNKLREEMANPASELYLGNVTQTVSLPTAEESHQPSKIATNTSPQTSSGCHRKRAGRTSARMPNNRRLAESLTMRWSPLSGTILR